MAEQRTFTLPHEVSIWVGFVLICGIFGGYAALLSIQGLDARRSELEYLRAENVALTDRNRALEAELNALREQYGVADTAPSDDPNRPTDDTQAAHQRSFEYTVQKGDTIWDIAAMYNVDVKALMRWNNLNPRSQIFPGDTLTIFLQE